MKQSDNIPNVVALRKKGTVQMSHQGDVTHKCKFCGEDKGSICVGIFNKDAEDDAEIDPKKVLWLCEDHYEKLIKSKEYRVRELPQEERELGHSSREEIDDNGEQYVTILEPENENKWLKVPDTLETDLKNNR